MNKAIPQNKFPQNVIVDPVINRTIWIFFVDTPDIYNRWPISTIRSHLYVNRQIEVNESEAKSVIRLAQRK